MSAEVVTHKKSGPPRWLRPIWARLVLMLVVFVAVDAVVAPLDSLAAKNAITGLLVGLGSAVLALFAYRKLVAWLEQRPATEADPKNARPQLLRGFGIGVGLFTATILIIFVCNGYRVHGWGGFGPMIAEFGLMAGVSTAEELIFRGSLFRIVEEWAGTVVALAVSAVFFGGLHLLNPHATVWGALAIAAEAGLMLGGAYVMTRSLWLPIALHMGWNFAESGIFGTVVSGSDGSVGGLLKGAAHGPAIVSGGDFGPEASIFAILVCGAAAVFFLRRARKQNQLVAAPWRS